MRSICSIFTSFLLVLAFAHSVNAERPEHSFDSEGLQLGRLKPGGRVAWLAVGRQRSGPMMAVRVPRGESVADGRGQARISHPHADAFPAVWVIAAIDDGEVVHVTSPGYEISATVVPIEAVAGEQSFRVTAPVAKLLYVRPRVGAWIYGGKDGGRDDADGEQNARLEVSLVALEAEKGNRPPPEQIAPGDVIVAIDSRWMRIGQVQVQ